MDPVWDTVAAVRTAIGVFTMLYGGAIVCQVTCFSSYPSLHQFSQIIFVIPLTQNLAFGVSAQVLALAFPWD